LPYKIAAPPGAFFLPAPSLDDSGRRGVVFVAEQTTNGMLVKI
jgi:hypothetical protein